MLPFPLPHLAAAANGTAAADTTTPPATTLPTADDAPELETTDAAPPYDFAKYKRPIMKIFTTVEELASSLDLYDKQRGSHNKRKAEMRACSERIARSKAVLRGKRD